MRFVWNNSLADVSASSRIRVNGIFHAGGYIHLAPNVEISVEENGELYFGGENYLLEGSRIVVGSGERMFIGEGTTIDRMCTLIGEVNIGEQCIIAPQVFISSHSHSYRGHVGVNIRELDQSPSARDGAISIRDQAWIGYSSIILPGTQIGKRSVIGALSKIQGDYSKGYVVVNGNPGVVVKTIPV